MVEKHLRKSAWMEELFFSVVPTLVHSGPVQYLAASLLHTFCAVGEHPSITWGTSWPYN